MDSSKVYVYAWHALVVVPLLAYIAYMGVNKTCADVSPIVWYTLALLSAAALMYHGYHLYQAMSLRSLVAPTGTGASK